MKFCPHCGNKYNDELFYCVEDNTPLISRQPSPILTGQQMDTLILPNEKAVPQVQVCPDKWLHDIATSEAGAIHRYVKITNVTFVPHNLDSDVPYINFDFQILNCSVFPITIEESIEGHITFAKQRLGGNMRMVNNSVVDCLHGNSSYFVIRQWISREEVSLIQKADDRCAFWFDEVRVTVKGGENFSQVLQQRLPIKCIIDKTGKFYLR